MESNIRIIRGVYLTGAVADTLAAVQILAPASFRLLFFEGLRTDANARLAGIAAVLMLSWALLLLWASARPVERRAVLGLTAIAIIGLGFANIALASFGLETWSELGPTLAIQAVLFFLFFMAFTMANGAEEHSASSGDRSEDGQRA